MRTRILVAVFFAALCLPLFLLPADSSTLETLAFEGAMKAALEPQAELPSEEQDGRVRVLWPGTDEGNRAARRDAIRSALRVAEARWDAAGSVFTAVLDGGNPERTLAIRVETDRAAGFVRLRPAAAAAGSPPLAEARMGSRASLIPPLFAILLAFLLRSTIPSLFVGVVVGAFLLVPAGQSFLHAAWILFAEVIWGQILTDPFHLYILGFVFVLSSSVAVITRMGGIEGMVQALTRFARSRRSVQFVAYLSGIVIFFDDYANTIIVGSTNGPLFDKLKVSRAKLAYIVDSTAAPVAGIALLSTWVAYQISTYAPQLPTIGLSPNEGYAIFLDTIPYRFYCLFALMMVGLTIFMRREFGSMRRSEEEALAGRGGPVSEAGGHAAPIPPWPGVPARWYNGFVPLAVMVGLTAALIVATGSSALNALAAEGDASARAAIQSGGMVWLRQVLNGADSTASIFFGSVGALVTAAVFALGQRLLPASEIARTTVKGMGTLLSAAVLLTLAWSIADISDRMATAGYLVAIFQDMMHPGWLPIVLFVTACFISFSTGSSWGTMAILQPNVVLLAGRLGAGTEMGSHGLLVLSIGAVLEGAIFGDHCSPISDTTVLSSVSSRCNHIEHVRTQAPYALVCALVALGIGYLPVSYFGLPWTFSFVTGSVALVAVLFFFGRRPRLREESAYQP